MIVTAGHLDHHSLKCASMMLTAAEKMARHLVDQLEAPYDESDEPPIGLEEAQQRAMSFALLHGQLDMMWEQCGFKKPGASEILPPGSEADA